MFYPISIFVFCVFLNGVGSCAFSTMLQYIIKQSKLPSNPTTTFIVKHADSEAQFRGDNHRDIISAHTHLKGDWSRK